MKRIHIHIAVDDLEKARKFYAAIFGSEPSVSKPDYAKWSIEDPCVNLAISTKTDNKPGVDHLGIQVENDEELQVLYKRLGDASYALMDEKGAVCCYAESDKHWAVDPTGVVWEMFRTMSESTVYGSDRAREVREVIEHVR